MPLPNGTTSANSITYATGIGTYLSQVYLWDPAYALSQDDAVYEKLFRDPVIAGAMDQLQRLIVGHDWSFEPAEDDVPGRKLAKVLEGLTKQQRGFSQSLYNLARAHLVGATWGLIFPEKRVLRIGDGKPREWTVVSQVRDVDKRRLRLTQSFATGYPRSAEKEPVRTERDGVLARALDRLQRPEPELDKGGYESAALGNFRWEFHRGWNWRDSSSMWWAPVEVSAPLDRWVLYTPDTSERGLGYGYGMADDLYYYYWAKQRVLLWGLQGLERWGQGFLYAKTKALRDQWAKGMSQSQALQQTVATLRAFRSENVAAVDENTELALLDMPATAAVNVREWVDYFDREIVKRILVALQPTGGQAGHGNFSSAKVEEGSTDAMVAFLRSPLEEVWTHNVVRFLVEHNRQNLVDLGLAEALEWGNPRLRLRGKETRKLEDVVAIFTLARDLQMPVRKSEFYEWTQLSPPNEEDGDDVVTLAPAQAQGPLGEILDRDLPNRPEITRLLPGEKGAVGSGGQSVAERGAA